VTRVKQHKELSYEKFARKILMKLTPFCFPLYFALPGSILNETQAALTLPKKAQLKTEQPNLRGTNSTNSSFKIGNCFILF